MHSITFRYSYSVNAKQFQGTYRSPQLRRVTVVPTMGDTITVFYNPDDPSKSTLAPESSRIEGWGKVVFTTALFLLFGAAYLLCPGHDAVCSVDRE